MNAPGPSLSPVSPTGGRALRGAGRLRRLVVLAACGLLLTGCTLRLETAPPEEPTPDAAEITRAAAVADVLSVDASAQKLAGGDVSDAVRYQLQRISEFSAVQLDALGGVYESGLGAEGDEAPSPAPSATPQAPTSGTLVADLADAYERSRAALATVPDPDAARLYASIAVSQLTSMRALASAAGVKLPEVGTSTVDDTSLPAGLSDDEVAALVVGEDSLGYAREVLAARLGEKARASMYARAQVNRDRASAWAGSADVRYSDDDPRQVVYTFPDGVPTAAKKLRKRIATLTVEQAHRISAVLSEVADSDRAGIADLLAATYIDALDDGARRDPLPGLPEYEATQQG